MLNLTSYENITVLENAGRGAEISTRLDALDQYPRGRRGDGVPRRAPSQVTVFETVIELENVTTTQNVSVLVNETVKYNATYLPRPFFARAKHSDAARAGTTSRTTCCAT